MQTGFMTLGHYWPTNSFLHRLDARGKLIMSVLLAASAVASGKPGHQAVLFAILLTGFLVARIPLDQIRRLAFGILWLLLFIAVANLLWAYLASRWSWAEGTAFLHEPSALLLLLLRLSNLMLLGLLFMATTVPVDAAEAFERLLRPLGKLRLPVHELGMLLVLSLSFIPIFFTEAQSLIAAHRMKTGLLDWSWRDRLRAVVPLLVPLFLSVFRRSDDLAAAMESRCYVPGAARGSLQQPKWSIAENSTLAICASVLLAALLA